MKKKFWIAILIGLLILFITNTLINCIKPYMKGVSNDVWNSLGISFGLAYLITYNLEYKEENGKLRTQRVVTYLYSVVIIFLIYLGISYVW
ncbi:hypothetical protein KHQ81_09845 [Mycoplasmatota bacterium]|nr:hypothetical protein KHQ81_09845 [Mycoplasmatota bacterium]